jgi:molybdate transport system substrate-binding protein
MDMRLGRRAIDELRPGLMSLVLSLLVIAPARADTVLVAVAANFQGPMERIAEGFKQTTGHGLRLSAGPTGRFYTQITAGGAPFEVLVSADDETPRRLIAEGHAVPGTAITYAIGQLVLWSPREGVVDAAARVLDNPAIGKLAVANPKVAPYGQAALEVLRARGLLDRWQPQLVTGESIAQAYQFVASGNAALGFVALSQVQQPGKAAAGSMWRVPAELYQPLLQDAVLLKRGEGNAAARALLDYLKTPAARAVMQGYGYRH